MIYIQLKNSDPIVLKKIHYAKAIARIIEDLRYLKGSLKQAYPQIEVDFKIIFK